MIVRKLRLQRGWSQEQLAEMAGVSVRTVQRLERGQVPSLETAKAIAAVFEVHHQSLIPGEDPMNHQTTANIEGASSEAEPTVTTEERSALNYVKGLKEFYHHAAIYAIFLPTFLIFGDGPSPKMLWAFAGWGVGVILHGLVAYEVINVFSANWEKRLVEKRLGRKL